MHLKSYMCPEETKKVTLNFFTGTYIHCKTNLILVAPIVRKDIKLSTSEKEKVVKALLASLRLSPPGGKWHFSWSPNNYCFLGSAFVFELYIDKEMQNIASARAIKCYSHIFNGYSISDVSSILRKYFESIILDIGADKLLIMEDRNKTILDLIKMEIIPSLSSKLERFINENNKPSTYLMPLTGFPCPKKLITESICWVPSKADLNIILTPYTNKSLLINGCFFPPINKLNLNTLPLSPNDSWLICRASSESESESTFKKMVGALSVILKYPNSHFITGRKMIRGRCKFGSDGSFTVFDKPCLAPAVGEPIEIETKMIDKFQKLVIDKADCYRLQIALEYLSDAWGNTPKLSFINASIAMDALFGVEGRVKKSILLEVDKHAISIPNATQKYELILDIRNGVLHGEYPTIETSPKYVDYFEQFRSNPIDDQLIILHTCILNL